MRTPYYREQALEGIAREVITAYQLQSGRDRQQLVADMAGIFQVSKQAMRIRLENHHLL